jgi:acyl dehydratase
MNEFYDLVSFTEPTIVGEVVRVESKVIRIFSVLKSIVVDAKLAMNSLTRVCRLVVIAIVEPPRFF